MDSMANFVRLSSIVPGRFDNFRLIDDGRFLMAGKAALNDLLNSLGILPIADTLSAVGSADPVLVCFGI
jgi:hypothetical protein